jgi:putative oxidoreductase
LICPNFLTTAKEKKLNQFTHLAGRILLALIFVISGLEKIADPAANMAYMQAMGVSTLLLWPTIALEVLGGVAIITGFRTRLAALALAGFCLLSALLFHRDFGNQMQMIMFLKNVSMAGGFLLLASSGATALSMDSARKS